MATPPTTTRRGEHPVGSAPARGRLASRWRLFSSWGPLSRWWPFSGWRPLSGWWPFSSWWPRRVPAHEPLAAALADHHASGRPRRVSALRADGVGFTIETEEYFTLAGALGELDGLALERCRGRVLDVGAGAGRHALALQARGHAVVAIDVSPTCVSLARARGVEDARVFDVMRLGMDADHAAERLGTFDTLLFGMQTIGVAGGVGALGRLLDRLAALLAPGGELLVDSSALREPWRGEAGPVDGVPGAEGGDWRAAARRGEIVLSTRYRGLRGEPFPWLYLAEPHLQRLAGEHGWAVETLGRVASGEYLVALRRAESSGVRDG